MSAALIEKHTRAIRDDFSLHPVTAAEIEFYVDGAQESGRIDDFREALTSACEAVKVPLARFDKENGQDQYEVCLKPSNDPRKTASDVAHLKLLLREVAQKFSFEANLAAKPYPDRPGSGMHFHVHLSDPAGQNIYYKDDETISGALQFSIGGLMTWMNPCMIVFAPNGNSYDRFKPKTNTPVTVSWGGNNRTVAIRLPDTEHNNKRIEHRVAGSDANPELVLAVILAGIHYGLKHKCDPGDPIFGDASLPMYGLPPLLSTREEAIERVQKAGLFEGYFSVSDLMPAQ